MTLVTISTNTRAFRKERSLFEKALLKAVKGGIKGTSWKMKQNSIFHTRNDTFIEVTIRVSLLKYETEVSIASKPMSLDPLYWDIVGLEDNKSEPLSFRAWGAFVCSSLPQEERVFNDESVGPDEFSKQVIHYVCGRAKDIESKLSVHSFSEVVNTHPNQIERGAYAISLVTSLIDEQKFEQAYSMAEKYVSGDLESCHSHTHGNKGFHELAIQWLQVNGHIT